MSTQVIVQSPSANRPLYKTVVRDGVPGNYDVIYEMIRIIRNDVDYDLGLQRFAAQILIDAGLTSYASVQDQLKAIFDFVASNVTYIQDIAGRIESLKGARQTLSDKFGDCDDQTILVSALAGCLGFENVKIAMARYSKDVQNFQHVYCVVYAGVKGDESRTTDGKRYVLDTSLPEPKFDTEVKAFEVKEIAIFDAVNGLDGLSGAYTNARHYARKLARATIEAVPSAVSVLPLGFLAGSAISTGASLLDQATIQNLSLPATASKINEQLDKIIIDLLQSRLAYDPAKTQSMSLAAQLAAVDTSGEDYALQVVGASIKGKLQFITNFEEYAKAHNIRVVNLDSRKMFIAGLALASGTAYYLYRHYHNKRLF